MSLRLRRIAVDGFRKFREPMAIEGLTDGLNIIIEPNETGKSTLLEALRCSGVFLKIERLAFILWRLGRRI